MTRMSEPFVRFAEHRRGGEVVVGPLLRGAARVVGVLGRAAHHPDVGHTGLRDPLHLAGVEIHRQDGVGRLLLRVGVAVAGGDVQDAAPRVDRRRGPDAASGRPPRLHPFLREAALLRLVGDRVRLPHDRAGIGVERGDAAAERAALVVRAGSRRLFADPGHRHVDAAVVIGRRSGRARQGMVLDLAGPELLAAVGVDTVHGALEVGEEDREGRGASRAFVRANRHGAPDAGLRVERPVGAAALRVDREHLAALAGDEQASADDRRLRPRGGHAGKPERPLELQLGHQRRRQTALVRGHVARVRDRAAEAVPVRSLAGIGHRRRRRRAAADIRERRRRAERAAREELGDRLLLRVAQAAGLPEHVAGRQRGDNGLRRKLTERLAAGGARVGSRVRMTRGTRLLVHRRAVRRLRRRDSTRTGDDDRRDTHS